MDESAGGTGRQPSIKVGACPSLHISPTPLPRLASWDWSPLDAKHRAGHSQHTLLTGRFSQGLIAKSILSSGAHKQGIPALGSPRQGRGSGGRPLPASELPCSETLTPTTCPTLDPRTCPLGLSSYSECLTGILASPKSWPPLDLLVTHTMPAALILSQSISWTLPYADRHPPSHQLPKMPTPESQAPACPTQPSGRHPPAHSCHLHPTP